MPKLKLASRLYLGPERWILDALKVNNPSKRMTRTPRTTKRISLPKILLLIHHQVGPNPLRHSSKRIRTVVFAKEDPDDRAKAGIPLPLASKPLLSGRIKTRIKTRRTSLTLSAILVSKKAITPTSAPRRSQKTSVGLNNLYVGD